MKKLLVLLFCIPACVLGQGIAFRDLALKDALAAAERENKLVFVDCFTEWCGPCKMMDRQVFPDPEVGAFMNPRFVCIQIDMEKGEGPELGIRYGVNSYPTMLILDPDGTEINRAVGSVNSPAFINNMRLLSVRENAPEVLEAEYQKGGMTNDRLFVYIKSLLDSRQQDRAATVAREFAGKLTPAEMLSADYWPLLSNRNIFPYGSEVSMFLVDHRTGLGDKATQYYNAIPAGFLDMHRRFEEGDRDKKLIEDLAWLNYNKVSRERASELNALLFSMLSDRERIDSARFKQMFAYMSTPATFDYMLHNRKKFYKTVGQESVDGTIWVHYKNITMMVIKGFDHTTTDADFARMLNEAQLTAEPEKISNYLNMGRAYLNNDTDALLRYSLLCFRGFNESDVLNFMPAILGKLDESIDPTQRAELIASLESVKQQLTVDTIKKRIDAFIATLKRN